MKDSARIWKHLLREGVCATNEVANALCMPRPKVTQALNQLAKYGSLKRYDREEGSGFLRFGVTKECKVPQGVTVREIIE